MATELVSVAAALQGVTDLLREHAVDRAQIAKLGERLDRLEERLAGP